MGNGFIKRISQCLNRPVYIVVISLMMLMIPLVNILLLAGIFSYLFYLRRENKKHVRNMDRVNDPFEQFYFAQEMCESIGKHYATIDLEQNRIF